MTIENVNTRLWFCCCSAVIVSEPFDFISVRSFFIYILGELVWNISNLNCLSNSLLPLHSLTCPCLVLILPWIAFLDSRRSSTLLLILVNTKENKMIPNEEDHIFVWR